MSACPARETTVGWRTSDDGVDGTVEVVVDDTVVLVVEEEVAVPGRDPSADAVG